MTRGPAVGNKKGNCSNSSCFLAEAALGWEAKLLSLTMTEKLRLLKDSVVMLMETLWSPVRHRPGSSPLQSPSWGWIWRCSFPNDAWAVAGEVLSRGGGLRGHLRCFGCLCSQVLARDFATPLGRWSSSCISFLLILVSFPTWTSPASSCSY